LRNEANFVGVGRGGRLESAEFFEGAVVVAVSGVDAALESGEGLAVGGEGFA
jgi:hypothetical protein